MRRVNLAGVVVLAVLALPAVAQTPPAKSSSHLSDLKFLEKVTALRPFLTDSPDLREEPQSIGQFFTADIYARLRGNAYYGYFHDEGFAWPGGPVRLDVRTIPSTRDYQGALRETMQEALRQRHILSETSAATRLGVCLVGVEPRPTVRSLPGVMLEVYFAHSASGKSFFWRFGLGSRDGVAAALADATEVVAELLRQKIAPGQTGGK
ncbi:MAG TPA: hypothetical protein PKG76_15930 [Acidobacteriota bacterium]|nr:hypothetical protein [Acidobacteriota bacterium]